MVESATPADGTQMQLLIVGLASFLSAAAVGIKAWADTRKGKGRDEERKKRDQTQSESFTRLEKTLERRFDSIDQQFSDTNERITDTNDRITGLKEDVTEVRSFCVGPDGKNGFRKDIAEIKSAQRDTNEKVDGIVKRELERVDRVGAYDRRAVG